VWLAGGEPLDSLARPVPRPCCRRDAHAGPDVPHAVGRRARRPDRLLRDRFLLPAGPGVLRRGADDGAAGPAHRAEAPSGSHRRPALQYRPPHRRAGARPRDRHLLVRDRQDRRGHLVGPHPGRDLRARRCAARGGADRRSHRRRGAGGGKSRSGRRPLL
ncbi:MAG: Putative activity regulator of membrane protease YbbK, partial [uncultured Arthrobacter sp.]